MEKKQLGKTEWDFLYLTACGVNSVSPEKKQLSNMNLEAVFTVSRYHMLSALVYDAIEPYAKEKCKNAEQTKLFQKWKECRDKALRKTMLLDAERTQILSAFEKQGIWYLPLKGVILKEFYPKPGMREMSDNDILFDKTHHAEVRAIMEARGYEVKSYGKGAHDEYIKKPVYNFEMHRTLYPADKGKVWTAYYEDIKKRLIRDEKHAFAYHFTDNDFYIYFITHAYKHYSGSGTGVRTLVDCYIYNKKKGELLDYDYIGKELELFGADEFERTIRSLSSKLFSKRMTGIMAEKLFSRQIDDASKSAAEMEQLLTDEENKLLVDCVFSGTYGTLDNRVRKKLDLMQKDGAEISAGTKAKYIFRRIIPDMEYYKTWVPFVYKHKILIPFYLVYRFLKGIFKNGRKLLKELNVLIRK